MRVITPLLMLQVGVYERVRERVRERARERERKGEREQARGCMVSSEILMILKCRWDKVYLAADTYSRCSTGQRPSIAIV